MGKTLNWAKEASEVNFSVYLLGIFKLNHSKSAEPIDKNW
jgi:hypothetical protein